MTIETLGALGDFLGGVAVVASLLYLAAQIRQNTKAIRSSSYHPMAGLGTPGLRAQLAARPGPLSKRPLAEIEAHPHLFPPGSDPSA